MPSDVPREQTRAIFVVRRRRQIAVCALAISSLPVWFLLAAFLIGSQRFPLWASGLLALGGPMITLAVWLVFSHFNWRCPVCDQSLWSGFEYRHCVKCGEGLPRNKIVAKCPKCNLRPAAFFAMNFCRACGGPLR